MRDGWTVPKLWPGETITCIASGPSLTQDDVEFCRGRARVIAINDNYRLAPWADVIYACDARWWNVHADAVMKLPGLKVTHSLETAERLGIHWINGAPAKGLSRDPSYIHLGNNGGYQALNLAVHFGAALIPLLGYEMQGTHWFGEHPPECRAGMNFAKWINNFATTLPDLASAGVRVVNCSRNTALQCFERSTIQDLLSDASRLPPDLKRAS